MNKSWVITAIVFICLTVFFIRAKRKSQRNQDAVERYVTTIFSSHSYRPEVNAEFNYGIPSFTIRFKTDKEKQHVVFNGLTEQFIKKIQEQYGHLSPRGEAFDAAQAVAIYSAEDEECWAKESATYQNKKRSRGQTP